MTTNLLKAGVDLDTLFMARVNTKRADVGILSNGGVDISNRFETIGAGTPIANTGFRSGGVDIATLFRNISEPLGTHSLTTVSHIYAPSQSACGFNSIVPFGSMTPATIAGQTVYGLFDYIDTLAPSSDGFWLQMTAAGLPQNLFTSIVVNGHTYLSSAAVFSNTPDSSWYWPTLAGFTNGSGYSMTIT